MKRLPRAYSREKRKEQVVNQFRVWHMNGDTSPKTGTRIAKALALVPSQHVTDILQEMVAEGKLICERREQSGRWTTNFYLLADTTIITEKFFRRSISVRNRGKVVGQMEMFSWQN